MILRLYLLIKLLGMYVKDLKIIYKKSILFISTLTVKIKSVNLCNCTR